MEGRLRRGADGKGRAGLGRGKSRPMTGLCMTVAAALMADAGGLANGGFEEADADGRPKGWIFPAMLAKAGYEAAVAEDGPATGKRCGILAAPERAAAGSFGNLMQSLDAGPWRGKRVRFR